MSDMLRNRRAWGIIVQLQVDLTGSDYQVDVKVTGLSHILRNYNNWNTTDTQSVCFLVSHQQETCRQNNVGHNSVKVCSQLPMMLRIKNNQKNL